MKKFKKVRTLNEIRKDPRVESINHEGDDGWWCYLKYGWQFDNNQQHAIHEHTIKRICEEINYNVTVWEDDPGLIINN